MRFDLVVFDLDGTLVDSLADIAAALNRCLARHGRRILDQPIVQTLVGAGLHNLVVRALAEQPAGALAAEAGEIDAMVGEIRDDYLAHPCVASRPYPGIPAVLDRLAAVGVRLAVLTNKPGAVARSLLAELGLDRRFADVIGDMDGFPRKPDPAGALELVRRAGSTPGRCLMVGDGLPDVEVARQAGCAVAVALWGYTPSDRLLATAPDLALAAPEDLISLTV